MTPIRSSSKGQPYGLHPARRMDRKVTLTLPDLELLAQVPGEALRQQHRALLIPAADQQSGDEVAVVAGTIQGGHQGADHGMQGGQSWVRSRSCP
jgi:hypothetical protein